MFDPEHFSPLTAERMFDQNLIIGLVVVAVVVLALYAYAPRIRSVLGGLFGREGFANGAAAPKNGKALANAGKMTAGGSLGGMNDASGAADVNVPSAVKAPAPAAPAAGAEKFSDYGAPFGAEGAMGPVPMAGAKKPQGCYPREQLNPAELLPIDANMQWAAVNPAAGDLQGKNFLSAGALVGVNTIGQSLRNANQQLRSEPPNPQVQVGPWQQSTIEPDLSRRPLE
jgi:type IV secretory pathway TrbL component